MWAKLGFLTPCVILEKRRLTKGVCQRKQPYICAAKDGKSLPSAGTGFSKPVDNQKVAFVGSDKIGISFICTANDCNTRITKQMNRRSYQTGTVLIQCPNCEKHHVIADNTGMYQDLTGGKKNIEEIAQNTGQTVTRVDSKTFDLEKLISDVVEDDVEDDVETNTGD